MQRAIQALLLVILLNCSGCATITFLPADDSATYAPTESLKVYWEEPQRPYMVIGAVSAQSGDFPERVLFEKLKRKAMAAGAHAIIMGKTNYSPTVVLLSGGTYIAHVIRIEALAVRFTNEEISKPPK